MKDISPSNTKQKVAVSTEGVGGLRAIEVKDPDRTSDNFVLESSSGPPLECKKRFRTLKILLA